MNLLKLLPVAALVLLSFAATAQDTKAVSNNGLNQNDAILNAYKKGVEAFNSLKFDSATYYMNNALSLIEKENKQSSVSNEMDTVQAQATLVAGYAAFYSGKNEEAVRLLQACSVSPYLQFTRVNILLSLSQAYGNTGNKVKELATIEGALETYPDNENLMSAEIDYYIDASDTSAFIEKMKNRIAANKDAAMAYYYLGVLYNRLASPKTGELLPDKKKMLLQEIDNVFAKAAALNTQSPRLAYLLAVYYYNLAEANTTQININSVLGLVKDKQLLLEQKKEGLSKAIPLFEKAKTLYRSERSMLSGEDLNNYKETLAALVAIYTAKKEQEKVNENKELLKNL